MGNLGDSYEGDVTSGLNAWRERFAGAASRLLMSFAVLWDTSACLRTSEWHFPMGDTA